MEMQTARSPLSDGDKLPVLSQMIINNNYVRNMYRKYYHEVKTQS